MKDTKVFSWSVDEDGSSARVFRVERTSDGWECAEVLAKFGGDDFLFRSAINTLRHAGWSWVEPYSSLLSAPKDAAPEPFLAASEIALVLARLADIWRGSDEAPALRSAAGHLSQALAAKSAAFDAESFWRDCRIDAEPAA